MASPTRVKRFYNDVLTPLFQATEPLYPYSVIFEEWAHYRDLLLEAGVPRLQIPKLTEQTRSPPARAEVKEIDFLIQVIVARVLYQISLDLKQHAATTIIGTEAGAVRYFLALAERYFVTSLKPAPLGSATADADRFDRLSDRIIGNYAQIFNWACQRLSFFYKTQPAQEKQAKTVRPAIPGGQPGSGAGPGRAAGSPLSTQVILKEEYVDRLYNAVTQHAVVKDLLEKVNLKQQADGQRVSIEVDGEGKGVFTVGRTEIDLRGLLVRIFLALKPEAELLLSFLVSKVQPNKVNLIELHYQKGLAEFEVQMMLEDGLLSQQVHGAITSCSPKTTFPKVVLVCASVLEEVLGKHVNIFFNRNGEVVVELPEIQERNVKNLAMVLRSKIEEAIQKEDGKGDESKADPEFDELRRIGVELELEMRKQRAKNDTEDSDKAVTRYDDMIEADLMRAASAIQAQENTETAANNADNDEFEAQLQAYREEIATDNRKRRQAPAPDVTPLPLLIPESSPPPPPAPSLEDDKLAQLEAAFQQTGPSLDSRQVIETLVGDDERLPARRATRDLDKEQREILSPRNFYRAPREVTMALLTGVRAKNLAQSRNPLIKIENKRNDRQLVRNFLETLDEVARECCGQRLETLLPELSGIENFFEIAKKLNEISERQQSRHQSDNALDILLSGAIMASSSIQLTN